MTRRRSAGVLRGASGLFAGGLVLLVLALCVAWFVADRGGTTVPGPAMLIWHAVAAIGAVTAQVYADRHRDARGSVAALAVLVIAAVVLATRWLA